MAAVQVVDAALADQMRDSKREFALDVLVGLSERPRRLNSKYFYDDKGSEIFQKIMNLKEYYPTDCEREILTNHSRSILATIGDGPINIVDLGAGDGAKTKILLKEGLDMGIDLKYVPIDISEGAIVNLGESMEKEFPDLETEGLVCEYLDGLNWLNENRGDRKNVLLFLGSNIGNFDRPRSRACLLYTSPSPRDATLSRMPSSA